MKTRSYLYNIFYGFYDNILLLINQNCIFEGIILYRYSVFFEIQEHENIFNFSVEDFNATNITINDTFALYLLSYGKQIPYLLFSQ